MSLCSLTNALLMPDASFRLKHCTGTNAPTCLRIMADSVEIALSKTDWKHRVYRSFLFIKKP